MAKTGGFTDGGLTDIRVEIQELSTRIRRENDRISMRRILKTEEATIRYQDVILGIERRWDAVMKRRDNN